MRTIPLFKYERPGGGVSVSPLKPNGECTEMVRVIADEGKLLQIGGQLVSCVDADNISGIIEVDAPEISATEALNIILGGAGE